MLIAGQVDGNSQSQDTSAGYVFTGNEITILFDRDDNVYKPAPVKFESWETTPYPGSSNSGRKFLKGMPAKFTVRVKFLQENARAMISTDQYNSYRQSLQENGMNLLILKVFYKGNNTQIGTLYPDDFHVDTLWVDYYFTMEEVNNNIAFVVDSAIPTISTQQNLAKQINEAAQSMLEKANSNPNPVLTLLN